ncbi:MAG: alkaline phosphatase family protein [Candidatus Aminicenantes bacterium]|jgi:predicted AlkP superfamily phosphohydrolase/phosphomutase
MALFKKKKKKKVLVIGLDGVPHSLLHDLAQKEVMPAVSKLIGSGHLHKMKASLPEISSVSWTNFMTGANPGAHGIFGFTDIQKDTYALRFPNFLDLKQDTFWDKLGKLNKKCIIINQPSTYPARKINGILISGFVAIELSKAVYPLNIKASLERMGYRIDIDTMKSREDSEFLWQELSSTLEARLNALEFFIKEDWDYFEFVVTGTDRLHHFLWDVYKDENHADYDKFCDYYRRIDRLINTIVESYEKISSEDSPLYILSDHGFTGIDQEVYLNAWLEKQGYLGFTTSSPESLSDITPSTRAFAMDPNRIYLNLKEKFLRGSVEPSEKNPLKKELQKKLEALEFEGKQVVRHVFDAEEIYSGPFVSKGPDLIVLSEYGFDMKGSVKKKDVFGRSTLQGMHTWDDAFFWSSTEHGQDLTISDLEKIILENYI